MGMRERSPHPLPSPGGRGEVGECLYFDWGERIKPWFTPPHPNPLPEGEGILGFMHVQTVHDLLELAMRDIRDMGLGADDGRIDQRLLRR